MLRASARPHALTQLVLTRFREFLREPESVIWTFVFPILIAASLGVAFRGRPPEIVRVVVVAPSAASQSVVQALATQPSFAVSSMTDAEAERALRIGRVALVVEPNDNRAVTYRYDSVRTEARTARLLVDQTLQRAAGRQDVLRARDIQVSDVGSRYIDFLLPGLIAANLLSSGIWGIGFVVVEARKKRLLKRLMATPMSRADYLLSYLVMRLVLTVLEVGLLVAFGRLVFGVPLQGSWALFAAVALLGALMFGALGLLIAARIRTTEGASGLMYFVMLPMWVMSGVFFASSNFPDAFQPVIRILPLTVVVDVLRSIMLQGAGLTELLPQIGAMVVWLGLAFGLALRLFRWR